MEVAEQTATPKSGDTGNPESHSKICLSGAKANEVINYYEYLKNNFDKL